MPRVRTVAKHITELNATERGVLRRLNFGWEGSMRDRLEICLMDGTGWAVIHYSNTGSIDGWALLYEDDYVNSGGQVAYFYVSGSNRRRGIGSALMRHVRTIEPEPIVYPHDETSLAFFKSHDGLATTKWSGYTSKLVDAKKARYVTIGEKLTFSRV
jgi:GNAT superfamily N-acetyltransferase